jgi:hypothetical protein
MKSEDAINDLLNKIKNLADSNFSSMHQIIDKNELLEMLDVDVGEVLLKYYTEQYNISREKFNFYRITRKPL